MLLSWYTVGNMEFWVGIVFVEEEVNLFLISLMGTTIWDGGSRERRRQPIYEGMEINNVIKSSLNEKALLLNSRNKIKWPIESLLGF